MGTSDGSNQPQPTEPGGRVLKAFVSYRRDDASGDARLLYDRLAAHFGAENIFLDVVGIQPGTEWLNEITAHGAASGVFIAVIGPKWMPSLNSRLQDALVQTTEDVVKQEIEFALSRDSGTVVIPVLVGAAAMPRADQLPRSMRRLAAMQAVQLRHASFDQDVAALIEQLEQIASGVQQSAAAGATEPQPPAAPRDAPSRVIAGQVAPSPDDRHYETAIRHMLDEGTVVPVLGSRACGSFPDSDEIASRIAQELGLEMASPDLPRVAQHVYVSSGPSDLYRRLKRILNVEPEPGPVHRFLAGFPKRVQQLGVGPRYQMILTTNYDSLLERAFDDVNEPYDLAVYMASGPDRGKFVHLPYDRFPEPITVPNDYPRFPMDELGELSRTVIVKVHGAVDGSAEGYGWKSNYVVTEDQYIDYLSRSPIESLIPFQILNKLRESHCLFLGYALRDWNLRVFLKRIWSDERIGSRSWAIEQSPDAFELDFWRQANTDLYAAAPDEYVIELERRILAGAEAAA